MSIDCKRCFHFSVCKFKSATTLSCDFYADKDMTVTLPIFDAGSQEAIKNMQSKGYCFVNSEFLSQLVKDSGELASYKAKNFVPKTKKITRGK